MVCIDDYIVASGGSLEILKHNNLININIYYDYIWINFSKNNDDFYIYLWNNEMSVNIVDVFSYTNNKCYSMPIDINISGKLFFGDIYDLRKIDEQRVIDKVDYLLKNKAFW